MPIGGNVIRGRGGYGLGRVGGPIDGNFGIVALGGASFQWNASDIAANLSVSANATTLTRDSSAADYRSCRGITGRAQSGTIMVSFWPGLDGGAFTEAQGLEIALGVATSGQSLTTAIYSSSDCVCWSAAGRVYGGSGGPQIGTITHWTVGDRADAVFDFTNTLFWGRVNGGYWNNSATASPGGTGGLNFSGMNAGTVYPIACLYQSNMIMRSRFAVVAQPSTPTGVTAPWG